MCGEKLTQKDVDEDASRQRASVEAQPIVQQAVAEPVGEVVQGVHVCTGYGRISCHFASSTVVALLTL